MSQRLNPWSVVGVCLLLMAPFGAWIDGSQLGYVSFREINDVYHVYLLYGSLLLSATFVLLSLLSVRVRYFPLLIALASFVFALDAWRSVNQHLYDMWQTELGYVCTKVVGFCVGAAVGPSVWIWVIASLLLIVGGIQTWRESGGLDQDSAE